MIALWKIDYNLHKDKSATHLDSALVFVEPNCVMSLFYSPT